MAKFQELAISLQNDLAQVDLLTRPSRSSGQFIEFLILKRDNLKLKIYQERGHSLPHIHVDYGSIPHVASYAINPPARIAGNLSGKYDRSVLAWINNNKSALLALWQALQAGTDPAPLAITLQSNT